MYIFRGHKKMTNHQTVMAWKISNYLLMFHNLNNYYSCKYVLLFSLILLLTNQKSGNVPQHTVHCVKVATFLQPHTTK